MFRIWETAIQGVHENWLILYEGLHWGKKSFLMKTSLIYNEAL